LISSNRNAEKHNTTTLLSTFFLHQHNFSAKSKLQRNSNRNCAHLPSALTYPKLKLQQSPSDGPPEKKKMAEFPIPEFLDIPGYTSKNSVRKSGVINILIRPQKTLPTDSGDSPLRCIVTELSISAVIILAGL